MSAPTLIALAIATAGHTACFAFAWQRGAADESSRLLFLVWLTIPATIAAIGLAPRLSPVMTAGLSGLLTALLVDTLLLRFSYFWPHQPRDVQIRLAVGYLLLFPAVATTCGACVAIVNAAIRNTASQSAVVVGTRKGARFSATAALLSLPALLLLLPSHTDRALISLCYIAGALLAGTIVGALTGCSHQLSRRHQPPSST